MTEWHSSYKSRALPHLPLNIFVCVKLQDQACCRANIIHVFAQHLLLRHLADVNMQRELIRIICYDICTLLCYHICCFGGLVLILSVNQFAFRKEFLVECQTLRQRRKTHAAEVVQRRLQIQREKHESTLRAAGMCSTREIKVSCKDIHAQMFSS